MSPDPLLSEDRLRELHDTVLQIGLDRDALLAQLDRRLVAGFPKASTPRDQIWKDLCELNRIPALKDGSVPLRTWLAAALHLAEPRPEADIFQEALNALDAIGASTAVVDRVHEPPGPTARAAYLEARAVYLRGIEQHVAEAHPLGLPTDLAVSFSELWTPVRASRIGGAESELREFLQSTLFSEQSPSSRAAASRPAEPSIWLLLGDPGSGKSWAMLRAAGDLAVLARSAPDGPLPLLVTARELIACENPREALRNHCTTIGPEMEPLLASPDQRWIVLVDGLDEAGASGNTAVLKLMRMFGARLEALLISSRPTFMPRVGVVTGELRLLPWREVDVDDFLHRWEAVAPDAVGRLRARDARTVVGPLLSSPQAATLCVLAARSGGPVLGNQALLVEHVLQTLWKRRSESRPAAGTPPVPWDMVSPLLRHLAKIYLVHGLHALDENGIERLAHKLNPDMAVRIKDALIQDVGLLTRVRPGQVDFPFRVMAEHLLGRQIWDECEHGAKVSLLPNLCRRRWAEEPVRLAVLWASHHSGSECAAGLIDAILVGEEEDCPGFSDKHLRPVLIALRTGADLSLPPHTARRLRRAAFRRIMEESSSWVGDRIADAVRSLAARSPAHAVPLFRVLTRFASDPRRSPAAWYAAQTFEDPELWLSLQWHRDEAVRALSNDRLGRWKDRQDVIEWLFTVLNDEGRSAGGVPPALAAARVLRSTDRRLWPEGMPEELRARLETNDQMLAGGAAMILKPDEASPVLLARAFRAHLLGLGADPAAVRELGADPEGLAALESEWPTWREEVERSARTVKEPGEGSWGLWPPPSSVVRERLWSAIGRWAALHPRLSRHRRARRAELSFQGIITFCEAIQYEPSAVEELFRRLELEPLGYWPPPSVEALARAAVRHPHVRDRLVLEWAHMRARPRFIGNYYPGHALDLLVAAGDPDATRIFAEWLPSSDHLNLPRAEAPIPASVLCVPVVREVALALARNAWAEMEKLPPESVNHTPHADYLAVLWGAWESDPDLRGRYEQWLRGDVDQRFLAALRMGRRRPRDAETLGDVVARIEVLGEAAVQAVNRDGDGWVEGLNLCMRLLKEVEAWRLEERCTTFLFSLLGAPRVAPLWQHACALLARANASDNAPIFARAAARAPASLDELTPDLRRLVVELAPPSHAARLILLGCYGATPTRESIDVLQSLPPPLAQKVLRRWRLAFKGAELPWTADWRFRRDSRPADRLRGLLFDHWTSKPRTAPRTAAASRE